MDNAQLNLTVASAGSSFSLGSSIPVEVKLTNVSSDSVWINKRLGVGYEDSSIRELFFTVYDSFTREIIPAPETERVDVHRMPPARVDFDLLAPGASVGVAVDLSYWHRFGENGHYEIVFTYQNEYDGHEFELKAFTVELVSNPLTITVQ